MKIENVNVYNLKNAIKASKYPMAVDTYKYTDEITQTVKSLGSSPRGSARDTYLHGIVVSFDLTFSNKAWVEFQRYHFAEIVSSQSTMHRITKFDLDEAYNEYVDSRSVEIIKEKVQEYNELLLQSKNDSKNTLAMRKYLEILYSNPAGMELTAHVVTNYGQLKTMYNQRYNHRLPEWREFCEWILTLPKFKQICYNNN